MYSFSDADESSGEDDSDILPHDFYSGLRAFEHNEVPSSSHNPVDDIDADLLLGRIADTKYLDLNAYLSLDNKDNFSLFFLNINSLSKHFNDFSASFINQSNSPKIIALCETKLTPDVEDIYALPGYRAFFNSKNSRSGGLALYLKPELFARATLVSDFCFLLEHIESICVKVNVGCELIYICLIYRRPGSDFAAFFQLILI